MSSYVCFAIHYNPYKPCTDPVYQMQYKIDIYRIFKHVLAKPQMSLGHR